MIRGLLPVNSEICVGIDSVQKFLRQFDIVMTSKHVVSDGLVEQDINHLGHC